MGAFELGKAVAAGTGLAPERMLENLQMAHLTGDMHPLEGTIEAINETWGPGMTRELATVTSANAGRLALRLARMPES